MKKRNEDERKRPGNRERKRTLPPKRATPDEPSYYEPQRFWDRNPDNSRKSLQRDDTRAHSFGYDDAFAEDPNYAGFYESNRDTREEREFRPMRGHETGPVSSFGGSSFGTKDPAEPGRIPRSANLYGSVGDFPYSDPGRVDYGLRGGTDYSGGSRSRFYGQQAPNRGREEEGIWDSAKRFFGVGPRGWKRSDERIREDVCEALARHPEVDASNMEVEVKEGIVSLKGTARNRFTKRQAEFISEEISGVEDVFNRLEIRGEGKFSAGPLREPGRKKIRKGDSRMH